MTASAFQHAKRWLRKLLLALSFFGIAVSIVAHVEALMGINPRHLFTSLWAFQLLLLLVMLPIIFRVMRQRSLAPILQHARLFKIAIWGMLVYYAVTFYWFLLWAEDHLDATMTWRMVSAGWILLFLVAIAFYDAKPNAA